MITKKLIDISFNMDHDISDPKDAISRYHEGIGYAAFLSNRMEISIVRHINYHGGYVQDGVSYQFFNTRNKFFHIPFRTLYHIRKEKPDHIIVQGLIFPVQVIMLRLFLGRQAAIIVQHHGERPFKGIKKIFQQLADRFINAYLFTSIGNAKTWIGNKIIKNEERCFEVLEGSTWMKKQNRKLSRTRLQIEGESILLWVGRLDSEKGPITILDGFAKHLHHTSNAELYMIYQSGNQLDEVEAKINNSTMLKRSVHLVGKVKHEDLQYWYNAADFYVSGSHREGSGYALIESLACGCIPIVTNIPPFKKITGGYGFLFEPGNSKSLAEALQNASEVSRETISEDIAYYFTEELSFAAIADDIYRICSELPVK